MLADAADDGFEGGAQVTDLGGQAGQGAGVGLLDAVSSMTARIFGLRPAGG